jgi:ADP-ribose pyrophosphatase YjhB (NUDIX family)
VIAQAFVIKNDKVLMVRQHVERGAIVWNFPGGGIEEGETPEHACLRELKEETGYTGSLRALLFRNESKYTFMVEIESGDLFVDHSLKDNEDVLEAAWVSIHDKTKWDDYTRPLLERYQKWLPATK